MNSQRLDFFDNLRSFSVCLVIVFHIALCYARYTPWPWYVVDAGSSSVALSVFSLWVDMFIMPVLFFISGYIGIRSLSKKSSREWWNRHFFRIALPWLMGTLIFAAPVTYLILASRGVGPDYLTFCRTMFFLNPQGGGPGKMFSHTQYWYLGVLLYLYGLLWLYSRICPGFVRQLQPAAPGRWFYPLLLLLSFGGVLLPNLYTGGYQTWTRLSYFLIYQPCRIFLYPLYFFAGCCVWRQQWFSIGGYVPELRFWLPAFAAASVAYTALSFSGLPGSTLPYILARDFLHALLLITAVFGLSALFYRYGNFTNKYLGRFAETSYAMYFVHMAVVLLLPWYLRSWAAGALVKFAITSVSGLLACYLLGRLCLYIPGFKSVKKDTAAGKPHRRSFGMREMGGSLKT